MSGRAKVAAEHLPQVASLIAQLCTLAKEHQIYGAEHPRTAQGLEAYTEQCAQVRQLPGVGDGLLVAYHNERFFLENVPLPLKGHDGALLREQLGVGDRTGFQLELDLTTAQFASVLETLTRRASPDDEAEEDVSSCGFCWLTREQLHSLESSKIGGERRHMIMNLDDLPINQTVYVNTMNALMRFMEECSTEEIGDMEEVAQASDDLVGQIKQMPERILPLTTIPYDDNFTYYHSLNVALLTLAAARLLFEDEELLRRVGRAAILHDIGKVDVPMEILHKPGRLTEAEAELVMRHPVVGARRLASVADTDMLSVTVAFGHHIKDNGQGYPKVSRNFRMGPITTLLEVADIFEALTANRPYKKALTAAQAFEVLYSMPNMVSFHPYMDLMVRAIGFNPVGSRVRTADGEIAVVVGHHENDPRRPIIRTLSHSSEHDFQLADERIADSLSDTDELTESSVIALDPDEDYSLSIA